MPNFGRILCIIKLIFVELNTLLDYSREAGYKLNYSELERVYGINRKKIKKLYDGTYKENQTRVRKSCLDDYVDIIIEKMNIPGHTLAGIHRYLVNTVGLETTYNNFKSYVRNRELRNKVNKKTEIMRFETKYGHQAQVDWKENIKLISKEGEVFIINVFVMILSASRKKYFEVTLSKNQYVLKNCILNALEYFGGVPNEI